MIASANLYHSHSESPSPYRNDRKTIIEMILRFIIAMLMRCTYECFESVDFISERISHIRRSNAPLTLFANDLISDLFVSFAFWQISRFLLHFFMIFILISNVTSRWSDMVFVTLRVVLPPHTATHVYIAISFMRRNIVDERAKDIGG